MAKAHSDLPSQLPEQPVARWVGPFARFLHVEAAGGVVLLVAAILVALRAGQLAPEPSAFLGFWKTPLSFGIGSVQPETTRSNTG